MNEMIGRYVKFMCSELPETYRAFLKPPSTDREGKPFSYRMPKIGPDVRVDVKIEVAEMYTRSAKILLTFDQYTHEELFFLSRHKGPEELLSIFIKKVDTIVNKRFVDEGRTEWIREQYEKAKPFTFNIKFNNHG